MEIDGKEAGKGGDDPASNDVGSVTSRAGTFSDIAPRVAEDALDGLESGEPISPEASDAGEHDADTLDALLSALQGNGPKVLGDAGLARFSASRLMSIERGARSRADDCLREVQCLSRLLTQVLRDDSQPMHRAELAVAARHLGRLAEDSERWRLLAEHAVLYRTQRAVAGEVARYWARWAQHFHEWPPPG
jgi:hypothetical protein